MSPMALDAELSHLVEAARGGDAGARDQLIGSLYADLKGLAQAQLRRVGRVRGQLDTTEVVHELYLRLAPASLALESQAHLLNLAARVMRQVIVDLARRRRAAKRGADLQVTWPVGYEPPALAPLDAVDLLALDAALVALEAESPRLARLVDLRFFGGLELAEIARLEQVSERTVKRDWRRARAVLWEQLCGSPPAAADGVATAP